MKKNLSPIIHRQDLFTKWQALQDWLKNNCSQGLMLAFSGGIDSSFLAYSAATAGISPLRAVCFFTPLQRREERETALAVGKELGVQCEFLEINPLCIPEVQRNQRDRCYHCKKYLFQQLREVAAKANIPILAEGSHADDQKEYRPGAKALAELGIESPLAAVGLHKQEIRDLAKLAGLSNAELPASPCLATRFPYDTPLSEETLQQVAAGETLLRQLGFQDCRLRVHGDLARVEIPVRQLSQLIAYRDNIIPALKKLGYRYVTCDMEGYQRGRFDQ